MEIIYGSIKTIEPYTSYYQLNWKPTETPPGAPEIKISPFPNGAVIP